MRSAIAPEVRNTAICANSATPMLFHPEASRSGSVDSYRRRARSSFRSIAFLDEQRIPVCLDARRLQFVSHVPMLSGIVIEVVATRGINEIGSGSFTALLTGRRLISFDGLIGRGWLGHWRPEK